MNSDSDGSATAPERSAEPTTLPPRYVCDRCGSDMTALQCKIICLNCGHRFDCSDLNLYFD